MRGGLRYLLLLFSLLSALVVEAQELAPVVMPELLVLGSHTKYEEDNDAVALIERTAARERADRAARQLDYSFQQSEQLLLALGRVDKWRGALRKVVPFFDRYLIHSHIDGTPVLPLSEYQKVYLKGYNHTTQQLNEAILYSQHNGLDQNISDGSQSVRLEELFSKVDLFEKHVKILDTKLPAPLSEQARHHYKYYLTDTIISAGYVAQVVDFIPRQPHAPSFSGRLLIVEDHGPRLLNAYLIFPKQIDINFVEDLRLQQQFVKTSVGWHLKEERLVGNLKLFINLLSLYVEQSRHYDEYGEQSPDSEIIALKQPFNDWQDRELAKPVISSAIARNLLTTSDGLRRFMDQFKQLGWQRVVLELVDMVSLNYIRTKWDYSKIYGGSLFDLGPVNELVNANHTEGLRIKVGGRTTGYLSHHHFFNGYLAYGFKDRRPKYGIGYAYSFRPKRYFREEFPQHELSLSYQHDIYIPGLEVQNNDRDNILYDVGVSYLATTSYRNLLTLEYLKDFNASLSLRLYASYREDRASGPLDFVRVNHDHSLQKLPKITDVYSGVELRWAIGERIFDGSMQRHRHYANVYREVPVLKLRHEWADKWLGGDFRRQRTELSAEQRLWMGVFGRLDYQVTVGKLWSSVPFPVLYTPPTNIGIMHKHNTFQLLNPLEFVADEWLTAFMEYHMRGVVFDRIPLINKLRLRGVLTANFLYGNLTAKNRQATGNELFVLPVHTTEMQDQVYAEVGFGLENILKVVRIDVYRRLSPLKAHSKGPWGVKLDLSLSF